MKEEVENVLLCDITFKDRDFTIILKALMIILKTHISSLHIFLIINCIINENIRIWWNYLI